MGFQVACFEKYLSRTVSPEPNHAIANDQRDQISSSMAFMILSSAYLVVGKEREQLLSDNYLTS